MLTVNNNSTSFSPHYTVKDIFYGYTPAERLTWFVTARIPVMMPVTGRIDFNYLQLDRDVTPHTFNRLFYSIFGKFGETIYIDIDRATPFSFYLAGSTLNNLISVQFTDNLISQVKSFTTLTGQATNRLFIDELDDVISTWGFVESINTFLPTPSTTFVTTTFKQTPIHHLYAATNKIWNNSLITGINDSDDSKYYKGDDYVFNRYFKLNAVEDDLFNEDDMTNPYTLEIHKALNAGKYSKNEIEPTKERFTTLGYYVEKVASLLGHRLTPSGRIDYQDEADNQAMLVNNPQFKPGDQSYSRYLFALKGMLLSSTPTHYDAKGRLGELMWRVRDIPQLLAAKEHDLDKSIGIEQGSQIRIPGENGKVLGYNNQLELLLDLHDRIRKIELRAEETYRNTLVTGEQVKGLMSGLGLPLTLENYPIKGLDGKSKAILPYYNYSIGQPNILSHLTIIKSNLGIVQGVLMPQKKPPNPWERWKVGAVEGKIK